jgi:hypothetical protein
VVRECLVWLGLPDPHETRVDLLRLSDTAGSAFDALVRCWGYADPSGEGVTADQLLKALQTGELEEGRRDMQAGLRAAIAELCPTRGQDLPGPKSLGRRLRSLRGRVSGGMRLESFENRNGVNVWRMRPVGTGSAD